MSAQRQDRQLQREQVERRSRLLYGLALLALLGVVLLPSRPTATAQGTGGGNIASRVAVLEQKVAALEATVSAQQTALSNLQTALTNEVNRAQAAEAALQTALNQESEARQAADSALETALNDEVTARQNAITNLQNQIDQGATALATETVARQVADATLLSNINVEATTRQVEDTLLDIRADALETKTQYVSVSEGQMYITNTNLHLQNGLADTETSNGKGNLILGYNEASGSFGDERGGSHNLVIGLFHDYTSYGGLVVGRTHQLRAPFAALSGGIQNIASGEGASVSGGRDNTASGDYSSVTGGEGNEAEGESSVVTAGISNRTVGQLSAIHGGVLNEAFGVFGVLLGGTSQDQHELWTIGLDTQDGRLFVTGYR